MVICFIYKNRGKIHIQSFLSLSEDSFIHEHMNSLLHLSCNLKECD